MRPVRLLRLRAGEGIRAEVVEVQGRGVGGQEQRLGREGVQKTRRVDLGTGAARATNQGSIRWSYTLWERRRVDSHLRIANDGYLRAHLPRPRRRRLEQAVGAGREEDFAIRAEIYASTAPFVPFGAPRRLDLAEPILRRRRAVLAAVACDGGQAKGVDVAGREPDGEDGLGGVDGLGEEVGGEGKSADGVEHYIEPRLLSPGSDIIRS